MISENTSKILKRRLIQAMFQIRSKSCVSLLTSDIIPLCVLIKESFIPPCSWNIGTSSHRFLRSRRHHWWAKLVCGRQTVCNIKNVNTWVSSLLETSHTCTSVFMKSFNNWSQQYFLKPDAEFRCNKVS